MAVVGRVLLIEKGNYSGSAIYNRLDWVRDNGAAWVCKVDGTQGIAPPTLPTSSNANWQLLAADGNVSGSVAWIAVTGKPFDTLDSDDFEVINKVLKLKNGGGGSSTFAGLDDTSISDPQPNEIVQYKAIDGQMKLQNVTMPNGQLSIQKNGTTVQTFTANQTTNVSANIVTDEWFESSGTVSGGQIPFSGIDDSAGTNAYEVYFDITAGSTNKNPTATIATLTGVGTSNMSVIYDTDADNGATGYLRIIK